MNELDEKFKMLMDEIKFDYDALAGGGTVTVDGKVVPGSQVAVNLAKKASFLAETLYLLEEKEV